MARIEHSIDVNLPIHAVYSQWTQFEEFPRFMEGVREVQQLDDAHIRWRAIRHDEELEWRSEILDQVPDQRIVWRDLDGPRNSGSVHFHAVDTDKTRVQLIMDAAQDSAPERAADDQTRLTQRLEQDLLRFKTLLERQGDASGAWQGEIHDAQPVGGGTGNQSNPAVDDSAPAQYAHSSDSQAVRDADNLPHREVPQSAAPLPSTAQKTTPYQAAQAGSRAAENARPGRDQQTRGDADSRTAAAGASAQDEAGLDERQTGRVSNGREHPGQGWLPGLLQGWEEPRAIMRRMTEEMDQLFERFVGRPMPGRASQGGMADKWMPSVEISQNEHEFLVCADLPGMQKDDVQVTLGQGKLILEGERHEESAHTSPNGYRRSERSYGQFYRMIPLPEGVDTDAAQASMRDGVLRIQMPLLAESQRQGRKLDIQPRA